MRYMHIYMLLAGIFGFNLYLLLVRRSKVRKSMKNAINDRAAAERQIEDTKKRLAREQDEAARRVERRNKTFDLYEQVRRRAGDEETINDDCGETIEVEDVNEDAESM